MKRLAMAVIALAVVVWMSGVRAEDEAVRQVAKQRLQAQAAQQVAMDEIVAEGKEGITPVVLTDVPENPDLKVTELAIKGKIDKENISFNLKCDVESKKSRRELALFAGDLVLEKVTSPAEAYEIRYDLGKRVYYMSLTRGGKYKLDVSFACRPRIMGDGEWREATFSIPSSNIRNLEVVCDRTDLEIVFPGAMRLDRKMTDGVLTVSAVMGPGRPFAVQWKPQVQELDAKLVFSSEANTVASAGAGALRLDSLFMFDISQGKMKDVTFNLPKTLNVTQVRGAFIRDWKLNEGEQGRTLVVTLNKPQTSQYALQLLSETALPSFPVNVDMPVIEPLGGIRAGGYVSVGTSSAIRLVVDKAGGLSQVDTAAFPRVVLEKSEARPLPRNNAFYYMYASTPYQISMALSDIVPAYDANDRIAVRVKEDEMLIEAGIDLEVRDAPIRSVVIEVGQGFTVSSAEGALVDDYTVRNADKVQEVEVHFRSPLLGRTVVNMKLELGKSPIGKEQKLEGFKVRGAKNERGYIVIGAEEGVLLDSPKVQNLREIHTGSVELRLPDAKFAYRFRDADWTLELLAKDKASGVGVEAFHLISLGEGVLYGSVTVTYFISGAPTDELYFRLPKEFQNVEFVSRDVRRWANDGDKWTVYLQRKVIGSYNLLVTYNMHYAPGGVVDAGGVECDKVDTQTGFIAVASRLNLRLTPKGSPDAAVLEVDRDELPYKLLVTSPILKAYKYIGAPHKVTVQIDPYEQGKLVPVVIDMMEIATELSVLKHGQTESQTVVRCMVKNTNSQFLSLAMPDGAQGIQTHIIGPDGKPVRVAASFDAEKKRLMIPLERNLNPNQPMTIEVKYGQPHGGLGLSGALLLTAPKGDIRSTFARWTVSVKGEREIVPSKAGNMVPDAIHLKPRGLAGVMSGVLDSLGWALGKIVTMPAALFVLLALVVVALLRRHALPATIALSLLVTVWLIIGVVGAFSGEMPGGTQGSVSNVTYTQVLDPGNDAFSVAANVVPLWRRDATAVGGIVIPILAIVVFVLAATGNPRRSALMAAGIACIVFAGAQFPVGALLLGHVFTWGLPLLVAIMAVWDGLIGRMHPPHTTPVLASLLVVALLAAGCASTANAAEEKPLVLKRAECGLKAEKDSMAVKVKLSIDAKKAVKLPVMPRSAILLTKIDERKSPFLVKEEQGMYYISTKRGGKQDIELDFLAPLPKAGDDQIRQFRMALPFSLTNEVTLEVPEAGMEIEAPTAILLTKENVESVSRAKAVLGPSDEVFFVWKPRARQRSLEKTSFFAEVMGLVYFESGVTDCRHSIRFQVAQGELKDIRLRIPEGMTVTSVDGPDIGAWRYDPATRELEAHLSKPAAGEYAMSVVTQISREALPYTVNIGLAEIVDAVNQRGIIGLVPGPAVYIQAKSSAQTMNVDDFARDAAALLRETANISSTDIRYAYRFQKPGETVTAEVNEVRSEIRAAEEAVFSVEDEKLLYNGGLTIEVAKAGVFSIDLKMPEGYDIDVLSAPEISHWDDKVADGVRTVQVHFKQRLLGSVTAKVTLSRVVADMPKELTIPRVEVVGALKHSGQIQVKSTRGVRLSVADRDGVSELDPKELGIRDQGVLAFRLLRPLWKVSLRTEVIEPRIVVDFLHVARVAEGLARHTTFLRYDLYNAGVKVFEIELPKDAIGVEITGPYIANIKEVEPGSGRRRIELVKKWFGHEDQEDGSYPLTVRFETQFDRARGLVKITQAKALGVDLQRGHVVVYATEKVELAEAARNDDLLPAEARNIPRQFGAGDLSGAAFCYKSPSPEYDLQFKAVRHEAASLLEADVKGVAITSLVTESGETLNRVEMNIVVGGKRYLETRLPAGAQIWTLLVGDGSVIPSKRTDDKGREVLLIPLGQAAFGEIPIRVDFCYVAPAPKEWRKSVQRYSGPEFDIPLKNVNWTLFMPDGFTYRRFEGTMTYLSLQRAYPFDYLQYSTQVRNTEEQGDMRAKEFLTQANDYAQKGELRKAQQAFELALNNSLSNEDLNEDARVQSHKLNKQQVIVGLVGRRDKLTSVQGQATAAQVAPRGPEAAEQGVSQKEAERVQSSLNKDDSDNLGLIADRMLNQQMAAAGFNWPLRISMVPRGLGLQFTRALQVSPDSEMTVWFKARPETTWRDNAGWVWALLIFAVAYAVFRRRSIVTEV